MCVAETNGAPKETRRWGVRVAESGVEPPRTIPNRVVPGASAGEYCAGDRVGGEAVARTPQRLIGSHAPPYRGVEQWQLVGLITQRSRVRIPPPLPISPSTTADEAVVVV